MPKDDLIVESVVERDVDAVLIPDIIISILKDKPEVLGFYTQLKQLSQKGEINIVYEKALYEKLGLTQKTFKSYKDVLIERNLLKVELLSERKKKFKLLYVPPIPRTTADEMRDFLLQDTINGENPFKSILEGTINGKTPFMSEINGDIPINVDYGVPSEMVDIIRKTFNVDEKVLDKGIFLKLIYIYCSTTITTVLHTLYTVHSTQNTIHSNYIGTLFPTLKDLNSEEVKVERPKVKKGRPKKPSFPQAWYNLVLNAYQKNKGVSLSKNEFVIPMKAAKTMFESGRKPKEIIAFMEWIKAHENEKEYSWLKMWTMYTVAKKLPEFLAGKFEDRKAKEEYELINAQ